LVGIGVDAHLKKGVKQRGRGNELNRIFHAIAPGTIILGANPVRQSLSLAVEAGQ
jgi:hypothetical protein